MSVTVSEPNTLRLTNDLDAATAGAAYFIMLMLFVRQAERCRTPSGLTNLSRWTFLCQSTLDAVSFAGYFTFAIISEGRPSLSLIAPGFLGGLLFVQEAVSAFSRYSLVSVSSYAYYRNWHFRCSAFRFLCRLQEQSSLPHRLNFQHLSPFKLLE